MIARRGWCCLLLWQPLNSSPSVHIENHPLHTPCGVVAVLVSLPLLLSVRFSASPVVSTWITTFSNTFSDRTNLLGHKVKADFRCIPQIYNIICVRLPFPLMNATCVFMSYSSIYYCYIYLLQITLIFYNFYNFTIYYILIILHDHLGFKDLPAYWGTNIVTSVFLEFRIICSHRRLSNENTLK